MKQTIVIDFDGVIHSYSSGWKGAAVIPDPPTPGCKEAIAVLRKTYIVAVVSSRSHQDGGVQAIKGWLALHEIVVDDVPAHKPPHIVVVDDRALRFDGNWQAVIEGIPTAAIPWNKKGNAP